MPFCSEVQSLSPGTPYTKLPLKDRGMIANESRQVVKKVLASFSNFFTSSCPTEGRIRSDHLTFLRPNVFNIHGVLDAYSTTGLVYTIH